MRRLPNHVFLVAVVFSIVGCVSDVAKHSTSSFLNPANGNTTTIRLEQSFDPDLRSGYRIRDLDQGSTWQCVGTVSEGSVYRSLDSVLSVTTIHNHEAYLVIHNKQFVGVYLPVEQAFVAADPAAPITFTETRP